MSADSTARQQHPVQAPLKQQHSKPCRVEGCAADLSLEKVYCQKQAVCSQRLKADAVALRGCGEQLYRFCQQCGKLQPLSEFRGKKRSCVTSLEKRKMQPELLLSTRVSTRRTQRQQALDHHQQQKRRSPIQAAVEQPAAKASCAQHGSCASLQQLCWPQTATAAATAGMPRSASCSLSLAAFDPFSTFDHQGERFAAAAAVAAPVRSEAAAAAAGTFTAQDCSCAVLPLMSAASASESTFTAAAAASLADAWWQSEQQQQVMVQPDGSFAPSSSAGTGCTGLTAAAAASSCDDESMLDSLLVEAINQSLAGITGACSAAAPQPSNTTLTAAAAPAAAAAAAAAAELEATDEELEQMIMQELAAAGIALSAAGGIVLQPATNNVVVHPAAPVPVQQMPGYSQQGQQQQFVPQQQCINAAAFDSWPGLAAPPAAAGVVASGAGNAGRMGVMVDTLQQQTLEVERMRFELKQLRDAPPRASVPAAAEAAMMRSNSVISGSIMTGMSGWHACF